MPLTHEEFESLSKDLHSTITTMGNVEKRLDTIAGRLRRGKVALFLVVISILAWAGVGVWVWSVDRAEDRRFVAQQLHACEANNELRVVIRRADEDFAIALAEFAGRGAAEVEEFLKILDSVRAAHADDPASLSLRDCEAEIL